MAHCFIWRVQKIIENRSESHTLKQLAFLAETSDLSSERW